jgi:hypothetical protein
MYVVRQRSSHSQISSSNHTIARVETVNGGSFSHEITLYVKGAPIERDGGCF